MKTQVQFVHYSDSEKRHALVHFFNLANSHCHGAARGAAGLLLSMYNGNRFLFDVTELRVLDQQHLAMAFALMAMDADREMEVHQRLNRMYVRDDFGMRFEHIAYKWRLKGRCKKAELLPVQRIVLQTAGGVQ